MSYVSRRDSVTRWALRLGKFVLNWACHRLVKAATYEILPGAGFGPDPVSGRIPCVYLEDGECRFEVTVAPVLQLWVLRYDPPPEGSRMSAARHVGDSVASISPSPVKLAQAIVAVLGSNHFRVRTNDTAI